MVNQSLYHAGLKMIDIFLCRFFLLFSSGSESRARQPVAEYGHKSCRENAGKWCWRWAIPYFV